MDTKKSKGMMLGLAIGDALGYPTEFMNLHEIKRVYGPGGITDLPKAPALFTDDTQMTIAIAEALVDCGDKDVNAIMESIRREFISWRGSPENNRAPGNACLKGVQNMERGVHWSESGVPDSKGCGSAMRVAPIGYLYQSDPEKLKTVARASGICTHGHRTAVAASVGAVYLVKLVLDDCPPERMIDELLQFTNGMSKEFDDAILKVKDCLYWGDEEKALKYLGEGWIGEEAVALSLYCFLRYPDDYTKVVIRGANTNGDSDSIACIAGGISGAYLGIDAIPEKWMAGIEKAAYLNDLATRLADKKAPLID
ncbi:MAG: ADP-ribosylglycohydrolase family protein [Pseudomonadota bacterium]